MLKPQPRCVYVCMSVSMCVCVCVELRELRVLFSSLRSENGLAAKVFVMHFH